MNKIIALAILFLIMYLAYKTANWLDARDAEKESKKKSDGY